MIAHLQISGECGEIIFDYSLSSVKLEYNIEFISTQLHGITNL